MHKLWLGQFMVIIHIHIHHVYFQTIVHGIKKKLKKNLKHTYISKPLNNLVTRGIT